MILPHPSLVLAFIPRFSHFSQSLCVFPMQCGKTGTGFRTGKPGIPVFQWKETEEVWHGSRIFVWAMSFNIAYPGEIMKLRAKKC